MKLYIFPVAPNPTRLRLYIAEKRNAGTVIDIEEITVSLLENEQQSEEHLKRNPFAKLPVLETDDGTYLTESLAIIEYLEELNPNPPMMGTTALARAQARELERIVETRILTPIAQIVHATKSPLGLPPKPAVAEHFYDVLPKSLAFIDDRLADGRPLLMGEAPCVSDCTLAAALQFGRVADVKIDSRFEHIARWDERFRMRPSAQEVLVL